MDNRLLALLIVILIAFLYILINTKSEIKEHHKNYVDCETCCNNLSNKNKKKL